MVRVRTGGGWGAFEREGEGQGRVSSHPLGRIPRRLLPQPVSGIKGGAVDLSRSDAHWMTIALEEAAAAAEHGDVPVGAVIVQPDPQGGGDLVELARARNRREVDGDPTAHAEVLALREAARRLGTWRLTGCTLYVTLEPCVMCAGALVAARVEGVVIGADDPKGGAVGSLWDVARDARLNHQVEVVRGVEAQRCAELLRRFFAERRRR